MLRAPARSSAEIQKCIVIYPRPPCLPRNRKCEKKTSASGEAMPQKRCTFYKDMRNGSKHGFRQDGVKYTRKLSGLSRVMTRPAGRVKGVSESRGSGRVGSRGFKISRVGLGRVKRFSKSRGSGRVMTREIRVTRGSSHHDPGVVFG